MKSKNDFFIGKADPSVHPEGMYDLIVCIDDLSSILRSAAAAVDFFDNGKFGNCNVNSDFVSLTSANDFVFGRISSTSLLISPLLSLFNLSKYCEVQLKLKSNLKIYQQ